MRFEELLERWEKESLSHAEAAGALGVSERTLRRWRQRYEEEGADGLVDRRVWPAVAEARARGRARAQAHELGYTTTRLYLQKTGMVQPAPGAAPIAASGRAGRCAACSCTRTPRGTLGWPISRRSIW